MGVTTGRSLRAEDHLPCKTMTLSRQASWALRRRSGPRGIPGGSLCCTRHKEHLELLSLLAGHAPAGQQIGTRE